MLMIIELNIIIHGVLSEEHVASVSPSSREPPVQWPASLQDNAPSHSPSSAPPTLLLSHPFPSLGAIQSEFTVNNRQTLLTGVLYPLKEKQDQQNVTIVWLTFPHIPLFEYLYLY